MKHLRIRLCPQSYRDGTVVVVQQSVSFAEIKLSAVPPDALSVFYPDFVVWKGELVLETSNSTLVKLLSQVGVIIHAE